MPTLKSSAQLKSDAREQLLGNYKTFISAYLTVQILISVCLLIARSQLSLQSAGSYAIYYAVYFILTLFAAVFTAGQNTMYLKLARGKGELFSVRDIGVAFRTLADKCMLAQLFIIIKTYLYGIPFLVTVLMLVVTKNYYISILAAAALILFAAGATMVAIDYSQTFYLVLDYPELSARELLGKSKALMKGHKGGYFYLLVSFIGIFLLSAMTFGIGNLWVYPYYASVRANYYLDLTTHSNLESCR